MSSTFSNKCSYTVSVILISDLFVILEKPESGLSQDSMAMSSMGVGVMSTYDLLIVILVTDEKFVHKFPTDELCAIGFTMVVLFFAFDFLRESWGVPKIDAIESISDVRLLLRLLRLQNKRT